MTTITEYAQNLEDYFTGAGFTVVLHDEDCMLESYWEITWIEKGVAMRQTCDTLSDCITFISHIREANEGLC